LNKLEEEKAEGGKVRGWEGEKLKTEVGIKAGGMAVRAEDFTAWGSEFTTRNLQLATCNLHLETRNP